MTKIAFIAHTTIRGGAATSLVTTLTELSKYNKLYASDCLLVLPKKGMNHLDGNIYQKFDKTILSIWCHIPFGLVFKGATPKLSSKVYRMAMEIFAMLCFLGKYNRLLKKGGITTIHLNSITLWSLLLVLPKKMRVVMHVRETLNGSFEAKVARWAINRYADTIIAIDPNVGKPFNQEKTVVIPNPIDMTRARELRKDKNWLKEKLERIEEKRHVISLIGNVGTMKGTDFLFDVAEAIGNDTPCFLIAGQVEKDYSLNFSERLKNAGNVRYIGYLEDLTDIYAITDINIRCEDYLPLGRTVWEGIYSGGVALLPVYADDITPIMPYVGRYIYTYEARNLNSCVEAINMILREYPDTIIDSGFPVSSNVKENAEQMLTVLKGGDLHGIF